MTLQSLPNLLSVYDFTPGEAPSQPRPADVVARKMYAGIIIISDDSCAHLEKCLTSLLHTVGLDSEVIVVDNASTDGSAAFISEQFPWVTLIRNASKEGPAAAYGRGVAESTGRYVVLLDPACEVTPGWLDLLLKPLEPDEHGVAADALTMPHMSSQAASPGTALFLPGCVALARRLWDTLGGLSAHFFTDSQDAYPCIYVAEALVHYNSPGVDAEAAAGLPEIPVHTAFPTAQLASSRPEQVQPVCVELQLVAAEPPVPVATLSWLPAPASRAAHTRRRAGNTGPLRTLNILLCIIVAMELVAWGLAMGRWQAK
ncbi:MAG TPA: glycosyltransferase [Chloroflexia bacterium]|nr:glycosyltransferase [Chloroflexia bacterium]